MLAQLPEKKKGGKGISRHRRYRLRDPRRHAVLENRDLQRRKKKGKKRKDHPLTQWVEKERRGGPPGTIRRGETESFCYGVANEEGKRRCCPPITAEKKKRKRPSPMLGNKTQSWSKGPLNGRKKERMKRGTSFPLIYHYGRGRSGGNDSAYF